MSRIYYDTEFIDDGTTIELISIGMISEYGEEYYGINGDLSLARFLDPDHSWHIDNTLPSLPIYLTGGPEFRWLADHSDSKLIKPKAVLKQEVSQFIFKHNLFKTDPVELWAWYGAYDHVALAQLFGPMVKLPPHVPMYTNDLKQEMVRKEKLGNHRLRFDMPKMESGIVHNAMDDARLLKQRAEWLAEF